MNAAAADAVAASEALNAEPNCFLMGMCGQGGAADWGILGQYSELDATDAEAIGELCLSMYQMGLNEADYWPFWGAPVPDLITLAFNVACE